MIQDDLLIKLAQILVHQPNTFRASPTRGDQRIHFGRACCRAQTKRAPCRTTLKPLHQRLGAMVAAAHRDALAVENGGQIVGVDADGLEGNDRPLVRALRR